MISHPKKKAIALMNELGAKSEAFVFIIDYKMQESLIFKSNEIPSNIWLKLGTLFQKEQKTESKTKPLIQSKYPLDFEEYQEQFNKVQQEIELGNSYLLNLTTETPININISLKELYNHTYAKYKLLVDGKFLVFSPECFVKIQNHIISTFPMKGTIEATEPNALKTILNDQKEMSEHATIVDLLRNDLNLVSKNVRLVKYRYPEKVYSNEKTLIQLSSEIQGDLEKDYAKKIGTIIYKLLPAGSISGAPKKKTVEIIDDVENHHRNYYTGVFGYFDGKNLESGVMIRFIERRSDQYYYKSGGGLTFQSKADKEYQELIDKIYVPIYRDNKD